MLNGLNQADACADLRLDHLEVAEWRTAIMLGYYTSARLGDCVSMKWDNVDFPNSLIRYKQQKTGTSVVVPMHGDLEAFLLRVAANDTPDALVCPRLASKESGGAHGLSQTFKRIMRYVGIDPGTTQGLGKRQFSKLTFHSLRHAFNSALANAGVSQELRMKLTGHKSADVNTRYTHHEIETLRHAVAKIPSLP